MTEHNEMLGLARSCGVHTRVDGTLDGGQVDLVRFAHAVERQVQAELAVRVAARDAEIARLRQALLFYAEKGHFMLSDESAWDTVSGEPQNLWCDEAGTATVEDGTIARAALDNVKGGGRD